MSLLDDIRDYLSRKRNGVSGVMEGRVGLVEASLSIKHIRGSDGKVTDFGVVSRKKVTGAFVNYICTNLAAELAAFGDFKFHDSGTGTTAESNADTAMETACGEGRDTGTQVASTNTYTSVATNTYAGGFAITEHGLFNIATGGILMDRSVFAAINVVATDQIEFTYVLTINAET